MSHMRGLKPNTWLYDDFVKEVEPPKWKYFKVCLSSEKKVLLRVSTNKNTPIYQRSRKGMWQIANQKQIGIIKTLLLLEG